LNVVWDSNGEILTGKLWRKEYLFFHQMPFYSNIPMKDEIAGPLKEALVEVGQEGFFAELLLVRCLLNSNSIFYTSLQKFGKGLDEVRPFSQTIGVDRVLQEANKFFTSDSEIVGSIYAGRIWSFVKA
jgi:hypothetical protein